MIKKIFSAIILAAILFAAQNVSAYEYINFQAYVEGLGWLEPVRDGEVVGTTGQARRMEALIINFRGGIKYRAHVQNIGWQGWVSGGSTAGTVDQGLRMEAIMIQLVGRTEKYFDVYYRAHVQNAGWLGWAKNGEPAGTAGGDLRLEALQIKLVEKNASFPRDKKPAFYQRIVNAPTA